MCLTEARESRCLHCGYQFWQEPPGPPVEERFCPHCREERDFVRGFTPAELKALHGLLLQHTEFR